MMFKHDFNDLTKEDIALLDSYFDGYDYEGSSYTFLANYIWRNTHQISWEVIGDYLCVAGLGTLETEAENKEYFMSFPLTRSGGYEPARLKETIEEARARFRAAGSNLEISLIPRTLAPLLQEIYGDEITLLHERDDDDYIYLREELVSLKGRKFHQKKNHLNFFQRNYTYTYEEITPENVAEVSAFLRQINAEKVEELPEEWRHILQQETVANEELLSFVGSGRLLTGLIRIDGRVEAATIGEYARATSRETVIVHVEKASSQIRGLYQAINNEFCLHLPEDVLYLNREEDMGMENLRQTKESYKPCKMAEKYTAILRA